MIGLTSRADKQATGLSSAAVGACKRDGHRHGALWWSTAGRIVQLLARRPVERPARDGMLQTAFMQCSQRTYFVVPAKAVLPDMFAQPGKLAQP